ncbi:MAG: hypothetical protein JKY95_15850 [Planctomycetaceae bacterium]|nr:hypothetical protein [Planctomycetaceae bacterium]
MNKKIYALLFTAIFSFSIIGCGDSGDVPEDAPATPEPASSEYDSYNNSGQDGPGGAPDSDK